MRKKKSKKAGVGSMQQMFTALREADENALVSHENKRSTFVAVLLRHIHCIALVLALLTSVLASMVFCQQFVQPASPSVINKSKREEESEREWMYALTERNMRKMYEQTWGWNSLEKRRELNHQCAKFVVVRMKEKGKDVAEPKAFAHFRFEVDDDDVASVYIYELQVEQTMKRSGLGKVLMQACERIGVGLGLKHMALTVLKTNEGARAFYAKIGYEETDHAPAGAHYVILRKRI